MADRPIGGPNGPALTNSMASDDTFIIYRTANGDVRGIKKADALGATLTGGGTVATGGNTLTVPATGTAALLSTAQTFTGAKTFSALLTANAGITVSGGRATLPSVRTGDTGPMADDQVVVLSSVPNPCMILFWPWSSATPSAIVSFRPNEPASQLVATNNDTQVTVTTGVLTGTTGTDGTVNFSASGGNVYVENRRGFGVQYQYLILG